MTMQRLCALVLVSFALSCAHAQDRKKNQDKAKVHFDLAVASMQQADYRQALRELLIAVKNNPNFEQTHNALGLVYHALGQRDEAENHYRKAIELRTAFSDARNNYGALLIDLGRYDDAVVQFETALNDILYPTPSLVEGNLGWALYLRGDVKEGMRHLKNAVATNPKFCRGYEWLSKIAGDIKDWDQVVRSVERFEKRCVEDNDVKKNVPNSYVQMMKYYLLKAYVAKGDRHRAKKVADACLALGTDSAMGAKCAVLGRQL